MTDQIQKPHHKVEDIPPDDADTQIALFEQSAEAVKGSAEAAEWLLKNAELVLGHVFETAEKAKDTELAERVQGVWGGVQEVTTYIQRQGAVIQGSKEAMKAVKEQRDKVLEEIKGIREALAEYDTEHPELSDYAEALQQRWEDYAVDYYYDDFYEDAQESIRDSIEYSLKKYTGMTGQQADMLLDLILYSPRDMTDEQKDLFKKLALTLLPGEDEDGED